MFQRCVSLVLTHTKKFELILTDNGSSDNTRFLIEGLQKSFPGIIIPVYNKENLGFLKPNNYAASIAKGKYFCPLNDDCEVSDGWAEPLIEYLEKNKYTAQVGPGEQCNSISDDLTGVPSKSDKDIEYIEGSCFVMLTDLFKSVGGFDERYEMFYYDDSDLSLRLRELGYGIKIIPESKVKHLGYQTICKPELESIKSKILNSNKNKFRQRWEYYLKSRNFKKNILIKRDGAIGDVLLITPVIRAIKKDNPETTITVETKCPDVLYNNPMISKIINDEPDVSKYTHVYDLNMSYENDPRKHIVKKYSEIIGVVADDTRSEIYLTEDEIRTGEIINSSRWVAVDVSKTWESRTWDYDNWCKLTDLLRKKQYKVVTVSRKLNNGEKIPNIGEDIRMVYIDNIRKCAAIISKCCCFVGVDSGMAHISQAMKVPSVILYGCTNPEYRQIFDGKTIPVMDTTLTCRPCHHEPPFPRNMTVCKYKTNACMKNITPQMVLSKVQDIANK